MSHSNLARLVETVNLLPWEAEWPSHRLTYVGPQATGLLGYAHEEWYSPGFWMSVVYPDDRARVTRDRARLSGKIGQFELEYRMLTAQGRILWVRDVVSVYLDNQGSRRLSGFLINISYLKEAHIQLEREKERAQITLRSIGDGVITTDAQGRIQQINTAAERLTGWTEAEARGKLVTEVFRLVDEQGRRIPCPVMRVLSDKVAVETGPPALLLSRDGQEWAVKESAGPIRLASGPIVGVVLVFHDVTEQRRLVNTIMHQATHDTLTELVNRREFETRLCRVIDHAAEQHSRHALLYMDLDQFKVVNDTCGHPAGDELLKQLSAVLLKHVRDRDTLARLGGDEFGLLMEHCTPEHAHRVAQTLLNAVRDFRFSYQGQVFQVGLSIGLVPVDPDSRRLEHVMGLADHACYIAKENGRNRIYVHQEGTQEILRRQEEMSWINRLNDAIRNDDLALCYQAIRPVSEQADDGEHWEILLRLRDGSGKLLGPDQFMTSAERYDLMPTIDRWVVRQTLTWLAEEADVRKRLSLCTINVSARTLADEDFLHYVMAMLDETAVPPAMLCFEITETAAIANLQKTLDFINTLKERDCRFALDDFGTGMASFAYLKLLPVDFIKIDGSFVETIAVSEVDLEMVRSINDISHIMGKRTIAEYVEDQAVMDKLITLGVDYVQGYHIAQPKVLRGFA